MKWMKITWIKNITPVRIEGDLFVLATENHFHISILENRYNKLIKAALFCITVENLN